MSDDVAKLRRERDLYLRLLDLGIQTELDPFLKGALALVVELTGAQHGYLEVGGDSDSEHGAQVAKNLDLARSHVSNLIRASGLKRGTR